MCGTASNNRLMPSTGYSYDSAGNIIAGPPTGATFTYDAENHLTSTAGVTYTYDGDGKRIMKSNGTLYWYGTNSEPVLETNLSNQAPFVYFFFNGQRIAAVNTSNVLTWYFHDFLGTTRASFTLNSPYLNDSDFYPFGGQRSYSSATPVPHYLFTGKERDSESGLDNFEARYFGSSLGRFMSADDNETPDHAADPQGLNLYSYVEGNPLNAVDPDGHDCVFVQGNYAYVKSGDCSGITNGTYVNGTVDPHSRRYNPFTHELTFTYEPYSATNLNALSGPATIRHFTGILSNVSGTHPGQTEFEKFASAMANGSRQLDYLVGTAASYDAGILAGGALTLGVEATLGTRVAASILSTRPAWARTGRWFCELASGT